ncbi:AAA family ATPase [Gordonia tangerina]|uniref:AAA family ATPase n=1 Tax=Gordonia tangerina TaxID=2911060 RepID=A0ABS9DJ38_9ACTN|nr:AAA family ATPase [Gordonia tangerina]MCF3939071.1 AAA family ATPase [Gordonia tangerina]
MTDTLLHSLVSAEWLDRQTFPPLVEVVPDIISEGFGLVVGPPKAGKSWLVGNIAMSVSAGGRALGKVPVAQRPVLYAALEDGHRRLQSRFRTIAEGQALPAALDVLIDIEPGMVRHTFAEWLLRHQDSQPFIILDTLGRARPQRKAGEDAYIADYQLGAGLKALVDEIPGSGLLAVHHSRKAESSDFVDAVSGTQGIAGSADYVLVLNRKRQSDEAVLSVTGRDVAEREVALRTDSGRWTLDGIDVPAASRTVEIRRERANLGDRSSQVLDIVAAKGEARAADVAESLGISNDDAGRYLRRLVEGGRITKRGRGVFALSLSEASECPIPPVTPRSTVLPFRTPSDTPDASDTPTHQEN